MLRNGTTIEAGGKRIDLPIRLVSRNVEGTVWLSQAEIGGTVWLARRGDGDVMDGAMRLLDDLASHALPKVEVA